MRGYHIFKLKKITNQPVFSQAKKTMQIHLGLVGGCRFLLFCIISFCFVFELQNSEHLLDLFPLSYLWCKNAVRLNVHLGLAWSSWVRECGKGTNDGSRSFSANCDLERSMSTQTNVLASARGSQGSHWSPAGWERGGDGGRLEHVLATSRPRAPSHLVHLLSPHTPGRKKENEGNPSPLSIPAGAGKTIKWPSYGEQGREPGALLETDAQRGPGSQHRGQRPHHC